MDDVKQGKASTLAKERAARRRTPVPLLVTTLAMCKFSSLWNMAKDAGQMLNLPAIFLTVGERNLVLTLFCIFFSFKRTPYRLASTAEHDSDKI